MTSEGSTTVKDFGERPTDPLGILPTWQERAPTAKLYADMGLQVFPLWWLEPADPATDGAGHWWRCACPNGVRLDRRRCKSPGKHPVIPPAHRREERAAGAPECRGECGRRGHGLWDATTDPDLVHRWWTKAPKAHIGMPAHGNGWAIIDVDPRHGGSANLVTLQTWMRAQGSPWPGGTIDQITGSGGWHHIFAAPDDGIPSKAKAFGADLPGLDTRGRGGYIVVQPSAHVTGGVYGMVNILDDPTPWPEVLTPLLEVGKREVAAMRDQYARSAGLTRRGQLADGANPWPGVRRYVAVAVYAELEAVRSATSPGRNDRLNSAAYYVGRFVGGGEFDEQDAYRELCGAARARGLEAQEIPKTVLSGLASGKASPRRAPVSTGAGAA